MKGGDNPLLDKEKCNDKILKNEKNVLHRAENILKTFKHNHSPIFREYKLLLEEYKKLLDEVKYIIKISDTYQNKLLETREKLKREIKDKNKTETKLKNKISELQKTKQKLEKTNQKLSKISCRDQLTDLYNRREFEKTIKNEWRNAIREAKPISVVMLDIDYFKKFNDNYGHLAGDNCLQKLSQALKNTLKRPRDFLARYGGEEFIAILPDTNQSGAKHVAELLRKNVVNLEIPHNHSPVLNYVTISLGVATTEKAELYVFEEILDKVDQALYQAKDNGRNQYCFVQL